jgi:hypothetical protein
MSSGIPGKNSATTTEARLPASGLGQELDQPQEQAGHPQEAEVEAPSMAQRGISTNKSITIQESQAVIGSKLINTNLNALLPSV